MHTRNTFWLLCFIFQFDRIVNAEEAYSPLQPVNTESVRVLDLEVRDATRDRDIPVRVYLPNDHDPHPVILFSHGLGGSREGNNFMGEHWGARGYVVICLQHPGSDVTVWKGKPLLTLTIELKQAANAQNYLLRVQDVVKVLDQLEVWQRSPEHALSGRLNLEQVGMSGHSFGALTTQAVSGQSARWGGLSLTDKRIRAAIALSPSVPAGFSSAERAFSDVSIPWLLMTGTRDDVNWLGVSAESRLGVFPALPPGRKYELVLQDATHYAFTDVLLPKLESRTRDPRHHRAILAISTAFWDACLKNDASARDWLDGPGPASVLAPEDRWQRK